jgi:hypothetical protein
MTITAIGARTKTASASQRQTPNHGQKTKPHQQHDTDCKQYEPDRRHSACADVTGMDRAARSLPRVDISVEEIVEVHAAHVERRHGEANQRDVNDVCCGVGYCGSGNDVGPHGRQIGHPA